MTELKNWVGVIGTLLGAIAGGGIAFIVSSRQIKHQRALEREKRDLYNFERIHELLSSVAHNAGILSTQVLGQIGFGDPIKPDAIGGMIPTEELRMKVDFYAPSLKPEVDQIAEHLLILSRTVAEAIMTEQRTGEWKTKTVLAAATASAGILKLTDAAKRKLNELVAPYTHAA
ncbi:MAG: hypothetical protein KGJ87_04640 [Planctomycetota bacterium]|nr:hypothetical protein [Planctomycetota bacterium]MDE1890184.1 hypothetical protein [Planctomycetota bacterium]MDE2216435.1 hypothetical protein [Planctomycetota bacterium]